MDEIKRKAYWRTNLIYLSILLAIWAVVSFALSIIFVDELDKFEFAGFKLGFWFAQQGSIYIYVVLILVYIFLMNRLDKKFNVEG